MDIVFYLLASFAGFCVGNHFQVWFRRFIDKGFGICDCERCQTQCDLRRKEQHAEDCQPS